ncbi:MAG: DNA-deoxyinosine glycosylase [Deltaproteobacteria bacterium]|nr:DNA-deoxyinosine glycosylase [Deltaproteobacteria bacterium]
MENARARVLILGTMPGRASLHARQYYAHPRNAFWPIFAELLGFEAGSEYAVRTSSLSAAGIALWDVLRSCQRGTSLDSDIDHATIVPNDFTTFLAAHPRVRRIYFNGGNAERLYLKYVKPALVDLPEIETVRLPSTSPAYAGMPFAKKLCAWRVATRKQ